MASTEVLTYNQDNLESQYLSNSFSNLSRSKSTNNLIVRTYKQATQLYLTKRFKEALDTLEPIVSPQQSQSDGVNTNGKTNGYNDSSHEGPAPIAQGSRSTRTKVWVFYLSLLNAIIELGQQEGDLLFGAAKCKQIAAKVRDGSIWEEIVRRGYAGNEGELDADVVVNLATLLSHHMPDQKLNQQRLETYLATADGAASGANGHLSFSQDGMSTPMSNSSSSPRALATRLRILELYTLHILPANGEWDYARSFIEMNDMLDEERKEAFWVALQNLKDEKDGSAQRQRELEEAREHEMQLQREREAEEAAQRAEETRKEDERRKQAELDRQKPAKPMNGTASSSKPAIKPPASQAPSTRPSSKATRKPPQPPPSFYHRASSLLTNFQQIVVTAGQSMSSVAILRLLMFMLAFLLIIARRDLRMKIRRSMEDGWAKVRQTIGMGMKVSYI